MPAFGENLRREREMRGVSLEEIASATKISIRFLDAIEREDFSKIPGGIFARSFIRTYARYLGLDEEQVVAEYQLAAQPQADFDLHRMSGSKSSGGRTRSRTTLIATLIAIVLLVGGYALFRYAPRSPEAPPPAATPPVAAPPATPALGRLPSSRTTHQRPKLNGTGVHHHRARGTRLSPSSQDLGCNPHIFLCSTGVEGESARFFVRARTRLMSLTFLAWEQLYSAEKITVSCPEEKTPAVMKVRAP